MGHVVSIKGFKGNKLDYKTTDNAITYTLREGSSQTNVILQYKLLASILSAVCSVIQQ